MSGVKKAVIQCAQPLPTPVQWVWYKSDPLSVYHDFTYTTYNYHDIALPHQLFKWIHITYRQKRQGNGAVCEFDVNLFFLRLQYTSWHLESNTLFMLSKITVILSFSESAFEVLIYLLGCRICVLWKSS